MTKETDAAAARKRAEIQRYEGDNDIVPGTASRVGGGTEWEGLARMAMARLPDDRTDLDRESLRRHPQPRSSFTGAPLQERTPTHDEMRHGDVVRRQMIGDGYVERARADVH